MRDIRSRAMNGDALLHHDLLGIVARRDEDGVPVLRRVDRRLDRRVIVGNVKGRGSEY